MTFGPGRAADDLAGSLSETQARSEVTAMIARIWHGRVSLGKSKEYLRLMREVALPDYRATPGNLGAWCLCRADEREAVVHFDMLSFWESMEAIRRFAGDEVTTAKYYDFDREFLLEMEPSVRHYDAFDQ